MVISFHILSVHHLPTNLSLSDTTYSVTNNNPPKNAVCREMWNIMIGITSD